MANDDGSKNEASGVIKSVSREGRRFPPSKQFAQRALIKDSAAYAKQYRRSIDDSEAFWDETAKAELAWMKPWDKVLSWNLPWARWFDGGELNLSANCLDRHLATRGDKVALDWEGEPGDSRKLTYRQLHAEVCKAANVLKGLGVVAGDVVAIYLPMIPEAAIAMLACTRIGATHTVVFGGFSAEALRDRINDCGAVLCITADGGWRRGKSVPLKANVDRALEQTPTVKSCLVVRRTNDAVQMKAGRDIWWDEKMKGVSAECAPASLPSEHPLFILYTSGTTGKPKGIVHTHRRLPAGRAPDDQVRLRSARGRRLLVHRRRRLGHRPQLRRLRPALQRRHHRHVRRGARSSREGPLLVDHRAAQGLHLLHGADGDPRLRPLGRRPAEEARSLVAAPARQRRRADQPRGLDVVPGRSSAAGAARSSTPGGRRRRAAS